MRQLRLGMCAIVLFGSASAAHDVATTRTAVVRARVAMAPAAIAVRQQGDTNVPVGIHLASRHSFEDRATRRHNAMLGASHKHEPARRA